MKNKYKISILLIIVLTVVFALYFLYGNELDQTSENMELPFLENNQDYNIILISIDTLRADHVGFYGYERNTTPNLDNFAKKSIVFKNAVSQAAWTLPSHVSVLTSKYPSTHGVNGRDDVIRNEDTTLTEILKQNGYQTVAFVGSSSGCGDLQNYSGFSRGFDIYYENGLYFNTTVPAAIDFLENNRSEKFFLFLHGYDVHDPYHKPKPFEDFFDPNYKGFVDGLFLQTCDEERCDLHKIRKFNNSYIFIKEFNISYIEMGDITNITVNKTGVLEINHDEISVNSTDIVPMSQRDIDHILAHYDGNILYADFMLGKFFDELDKLKILDKTIVIIFADHGENLANHVDTRLFLHESLHDEIVHAPLMIRHPKLQPRVIENQAQLIDIMPTIFDFLKINKPDDLQGRGLLPLLKNNVDVDPYTFSELKMNIFQRSIRTPKWQLIDKFDSFELYDLENDKKELVNVVDKFPDVKRDLENRLLLKFLNS